ncbi:MAG: hypothetical protein M3R14_03020 [Acidobacteriota bacterium]|nr:hypothetical protein [Acidobacteriota bacterium]
MLPSDTPTRTATVTRAHVSPRRIGPLVITSVATPMASRQPPIDRSMAKTNAAYRGSRRPSFAPM